MAYRINAASDRIRRNVGTLPLNSSCTYMADFQIVSDVGAPAIQPLITTSIATFTESFGVYFEGSSGDGLMKLSYTDASVATEVNFTSRPAVGSVFCLYLRCSGTAAGQFDAGWRYPNSAWVVCSGTLPASVAQTTLYEFGSLAAFYYSDCRVQNVKVWDRALSSAELLAESDSEGVLHKTGLYCHWPLTFVNDIFDRGPFARNVVQAGTMETEPLYFPRKGHKPRPPVPYEAAASTTFQILAGRKFSLAGMAGLAGD